MPNTRSRAENLLESYDDIITGLMNQMDTYAQQSGGYINKMHPDQYDRNGNRKDHALSEQSLRRSSGYMRPLSRR